ncbi:alpha-crystallin A chain-like isoform X2 [Daphnia carinata]|uniref:alpha-crystallin A chain-like isoform X2 n=1 Tax=Daphnia carinata TaxID=120202 RepID=UPI00257EAE87|nr:alpha-crystallin A chain-like isoform X2 [Daphnia carinata]
MALLQCDPFGDLCFVGLPFTRDPWKIVPRDTLTAWAETPFPYLRRSGICPVPGVSQRTVSEVVNNQDKFQVTLNLKNFKSNEVNVKVIDQTLCVCAEHEEKPDDSGRIYRKIKRRYFLPNNVDCDKINATFSDDGTLIVSAGKKAIGPGKERNIEIKHLPAQKTQQSLQQESQTSEKAKQAGVNIPVTRETEKK